MIDDRAIKAGRAFEDDVAALLGAEKVPGSGNQWYAKLDVGKVGELLMSLKWTGVDPFPRLSTLMAEVDDAILAPGGAGPETAGAVVTGGPTQRTMVHIDLLTFAKLFEEKAKLARQSKADARVERSKTPIALRDET